MTAESATPVAFRELGLSDALLNALATLGYETPSPIQAQTIPLLLEGRDLLGQAQTGTGKTAAFALPALARLDPAARHVQVLVLVPTRELAIQVAEAFRSYAQGLDHFDVLAVYGGADYRGQLSALKRGVPVVVGTPGRVMDHMRRGSLALKQLRTLVLDEADEMLRMGFIDDVEWILEQTPENRQIALFSATIPKEIRRIAHRHLKNAAEITISLKTVTVSAIRQRYWLVSGINKTDALLRILEAEESDGILVFVRTRIETVEVADRLRERGYRVAALNGDIVQAQREKTVNQLKRGDLDILVATDVAARGLDVERISHVINYDIPVDTEAYVHRIGRTGRAGRSGDAILFVAPREKRMLFAIEKATRQVIEAMELPSARIINEKRVVRFRKKIAETLEQLLLSPARLEEYAEVIRGFQRESGAETEHIAAALAVLAQGGKDLLLKDKPGKEPSSFPRQDKAAAHREAPRKEHRDRPVRERQHDERKHDDRKHDERKPLDERSKRPREPKAVPEEMERYRIDVGHVNEIKPGNIVGAIANEADLDSQYIGHITIHDEYSTVDLPKDMPKETLEILRKARVGGRPMNLRRLGDDKPFAAPFSPKSGGEKPFRKKFRGPETDGKPHGKKVFDKKDVGKKDFGKKDFVKKDFVKKDFGKKAFGKKVFDKKPFGKSKPGSWHKPGSPSVPR